MKFHFDSLAKAFATFAICGLAGLMIYKNIDACGIGFLVAFGIFFIWGK